MLVVTVRCWTGEVFYKVFDCIDVSVNHRDVTGNIGSFQLGSHNATRFRLGQ